jgi:hypothetical protein
MGVQACQECGWIVEGGYEGCRAHFETLLARDFSDPLYFRTHRLMVDAYCLQHPEDFCRSANSLAAHLAGLCAIVERGASPAVGPELLHRWLNGDRRLDKPMLPAERGAVTLGDLPAEAAPGEWAEAVRAWADSIWAAYVPLHAVARAWLDEAKI